MDPNVPEEEEAPQSAQQVIDEGRAHVEDQVRRGKTIMRDLLKLRAKGKKAALIWNDNGQLVGKSAKALTGFVGCTVRNKVPITVTDWRKVNKKIRNEIWSEVQVSYFFYN